MQNMETIQPLVTDCSVLIKMIKIIGLNYFFIIRVLWSKQGTDERSKHFEWLKEVSTYRCIGPFW